MAWPFSRSSSASSGAALYAAIVTEMRRPDYYRSAAVPDTMDGRFALLATLLALTDIRLGQGGAVALERAPRLAECFIADMDVQMREEGFGDPSLGKQVRMMVGSLASRVDRWKAAIERDGDWSEATVASLYRDEPPGAAEVKAGEAMLWAYWVQLEGSTDDALVEGQIG
ncbi:MAG: ubiquinol-cytochrome C chaperone family protein [Sphingomicrobium sp.]